MKNLPFYLLLLLGNIILAQAPQGFSYQAVAFDASGNPIQGASVTVKISILNESETGTAVYEEIHTPTTNTQGLFNLNIGMGSSINGVFSNINWGQNAKFIKVEIDPNGGTNFTIIGVNQLMSVPYALFSEKSNSVEGDTGGSAAFHDTQTNRVEAFHIESNSWIGHVADDNSTLIGSSGNFAFHSPQYNSVEVFTQENGTWVGHTAYDNSTLIKSNGSFAFHDPQTNRVEAFHIESNSWIGHSASDSSTLSGCNGSFIFHDPLTNRVEIFTQKTGIWTGHSASDNTILVNCD